MIWQTTRWPEKISGVTLLIKQKMFVGAANWNIFGCHSSNGK